MLKSLFLYIFLTVSIFSCSPKTEERPLTVVVFGATGDLTARKIFPALSNLARDRALPEKFAVVGVGRREYTHEDFRKHSKGFDPGERLFYAQVDFEENRGYRHLEEMLARIDGDFGAKSNRIYFLATQPSFFAPIVEQLGAHGMITDPGTGGEWSRVMIEKPFGHDLESAVALQESIARTLDEGQIYRIDHYLEKEGVQKLLSFRLKGEFESLWNNRHIDHVQITMSEEIGIGSRARFWEETGLLRDVIQNHILQILSLLAIDLPDRDIPAQKLKLLQAIRPIGFNEIVRGQYGPREHILGYKQEPGVPESSHVETFAAAKLWIDSERWEGVPFYIRAGKRLAAQLTEIAVFFKNDPNPLVIRVQPNPGIFWNGKEIHSTDNSNREAYEALLLDCIKGDQSRFVQKEEQFAAWRLLAPILRDWNAPPQEPFPNYGAGTWGPEEAEQLLHADGRKWRNLVR